MVALMYSSRLDTMYTYLELRYIRGIDSMTQEQKFSLVKRYEYSHIFIQISTVGNLKARTSRSRSYIAFFISLNLAITSTGSVFPVTFCISES